MAKSSTSACCLPWTADRSFWCCISSAISVPGNLVQATSSPAPRNLWYQKRRLRSLKDGHCRIINKNKTSECHRLKASRGIPTVTPSVNGTAHMDMSSVNSYPRECRVALRRHFTLDFFQDDQPYIPDRAIVCHPPPSTNMRVNRDQPG